MYDKRLGLLWVLSAASIFGSSFFQFARGQQQQQQQQQPAVPTPTQASATQAPTKTLIEILDNTFSYRSLSNIITTAGLRDSLLGIGPFTVFAPPNGALAITPNFQMLLSPGFYLHLRELALFHISSQGALSAADLVDGLSIPMLNGKSIDVKNDQGLITLITPDGAESIITQPDEKAMNGVVHKINPALFPSFVSNNLFDIGGTFFQELVTLAGMEEDVKTRALTLLLPTTAALINVPSSTFTDPELAAEFLKYHLIEGAYPSTLLPSGPLETLQGEPVYVSKSGSDVSFNGFPAVEMNILANNGIAYRVDSVLEPQTQGPTLVPVPDETISLAKAIASDVTLSGLRSAMVAAGYTDELSDGPRKIVFGPTNSAFDEATKDMRGALTGAYAGSEWIAHLQNLLQMHVTLDTANELTNGLTLQMLNNDIAKVSVGSNGTISVAGPDGAGGAVVGPAVTASNGVLYKMNGVLLPHWKSTNLVDVLKEDGKFNTLVELISLAGLEGQFSSRLYTVLAPIDDAFNKLNPSVIANLKAPQNVNQLRAILEYHIIPKILPSSQVQNGPIVTLANKQVTAKSSSGNIQFDDVQVVEADILANNGLIYALNGVLDTDYVPGNTTSPNGAPTTTPPPPTMRPQVQTLDPDVPRGWGSDASSGTRPNAFVRNVVISIVCLVVSFGGLTM